MRFECRTYFDITATGITGHFKMSKVPFKDRAGQEITDEKTWNRARNQQRNWETLTQLISMRTQLFKITEPTCNKKQWHFEFETESAGVFDSGNDSVGLLVRDAAGVPMLVNLDNYPNIAPLLVATGPEQNIFFSAKT